MEEKRNVNENMLCDEELEQVSGGADGMNRYLEVGNKVKYVFACPNCNKYPAVGEIRHLSFSLVSGEAVLKMDCCGGECKTQTNWLELVKG